MGLFTSESRIKQREREKVGVENEQKEMRNFNFLLGDLKSSPAHLPTVIRWPVSSEALVKLFANSRI